MAHKITQRQPQTPPQIGDNSQAVEEAARVQLISLMAKLNAADADIEEAAAVMKAKRKVRSQIIGLGKSLGFPAWELLRRQQEMAKTKSEMADQVSRESQQRRWLDIITPEQLSMHFDGNTPEEVRDAADWQSDGYRAGLLNKPATVPEGVPPRHMQDWLKGHEAGFKDYLLTLAENAPKPKNKTAQEVAEEAAKHFAEDNPEVGTPEHAKAERAAIRKAKESLAKMGSESDEAVV